MYTVQDLSSRFALHPKSVRERLSSLDRLVEHHVVRGRNNAILLSDAGLAVFDRLIQLEREGFATATAVQRVENELSDATPTPRQPKFNEPPTNGELGHDILIEELRDRVKSLERDKDRLLQLLEDQGQQLLALTAGPKPSESQASTNGPQFTRLQALRYALLGR